MLRQISKSRVECSVRGCWQEEWGQQQVVGNQNPMDCVGLSPHLLLSQFKFDHLLNPLCWSRTPNINCDQTKSAGSSKICSENLFQLENQILGGGRLLHGATGDGNYAEVTNITVVPSDKYNR